ncbi:MAG: aminopeptidase N C-terminal domain-containing protein, partial [Pseudomonadota bacterium]
MAQHLQPVAEALYKRYQVEQPYAPDAEQSAARALANASLGLLSRLDGGALADKQFRAASNMTQQLAAFACLLRHGDGEVASAAFYDQWKHERLVVDTWFMMQIAQAHPEKAAAVAAKLTAHPDFSEKNPNRFRATLGALTMNAAGFHQSSGAGYSLLADWLIRLDSINPQTTARMCTAFQTWRRYDPQRQKLIKAELERILSTPGLSRDTTEMLTRMQE